MRRRYDRPPFAPWPEAPSLDRGPAAIHEPFDGCGLQIRFLRITWTSVNRNEILMTAILSKPADWIDLGDIQALIDERVPEGAQIEFKESLPARGSGDPDLWMQGNGRIGDRARNEILEEVVAFANAYGGAMVLGIAEDGAKPPVAAAVTSLPSCADLADRFRLVFRDCVGAATPDARNRPGSDERRHRGHIVPNQSVAPRAASRHADPRMPGPTGRPLRSPEYAGDSGHDPQSGARHGTAGTPAARAFQEIRGGIQATRNPRRRFRVSHDGRPCRRRDSSRVGLFRRQPGRRITSAPTSRLHAGQTTGTPDCAPFESCMPCTSKTGVRCSGQHVRKKVTTGIGEWKDTLTPKSTPTACWNGALSRIVFSFIPIPLKARSNRIWTRKRQSRRWPGFSFGWTGCGSGQRLLRQSMPFNRNSELRRTASM